MVTTFKDDNAGGLINPKPLVRLESLLISRMKDLRLQNKSRNTGNLTNIKLETKLFRNSFIQLHHGFYDDKLPDEKSHIYGVKTKYDEGVKGALFNENEYGVKKMINDIKEEQYASKQRYFGGNLKKRAFGIASEKKL